MSQMIRVAVCGAAGRMGLEIVKSVAGAEDMDLAGAVDLKENGADVGQLAGLEPLGIKVCSNLDILLANSDIQVMIDFTSPDTVMKNLRTALKHSVSAVVGTTGLEKEDLQKVSAWVTHYKTGAIIAPNFALGAVVLMKAAQLCARYMEGAEIIEMHHDQKLDAPSGTAWKTAMLISEAVKDQGKDNKKVECEPDARGAKTFGIPVHSVRLPGMVAHQEVIFGGEGQILTLRHDALNRKCFMPGLLLAVRKARANKKLIYGIENLIEF